MGVMKQTLAAFTSPGPAHYNTTGPKKGNAEWKPPKILCFFKGSDSCSSCEQHLYGDYYKDSSGLLILCLYCYRKLRDPIRNTPTGMTKYRHCSAYHQHINVENIVYHKTTLKRVRRLEMLEKAMWNRFGEVLDSKGLPK